MAVYYWGTSGRTVALIQERLKGLGYYPKEIDGIFGAYTYYALTAFQTDGGMAPNGIAERETLEKLGIKTVRADENDIYALAGFIGRNAVGEPYAAQVAVGAVVMNRAADGGFRDSIGDIISSFEEGKALPRKPEKTHINASRDAVNGWDPSGGALWFAGREELPKGKVKKRIGRLVFG